MCIVVFVIKKKQKLYAHVYRYVNINIKEGYRQAINR